MLDAFLEVVSGHTKTAEVRGRLMATLERLPTAELQKIASGEAILKEGYEEGCWLEKFKGSPLYDQALEIEKEDLDIQMQEQHRRQMETELRAQLPTWDETDLRRTNLSIKRKLLELDLAGAALGDGGGGDALGGQEGEDVAPPDLEAAEAAAMPPEPKAEGSAPPPPAPAAAAPADKPEAESAAPPGDPTPSPDSGKDKKPPTTKVTTVEKPSEPKERVDIKAAAARMRFALATTKEASGALTKEARVKEAFGAALLQGLKGMGQFATSGAKTLQAAHAAGGMGAVGQAAKTLGGQGVARAGKFIAQNPGAGAAMVAAPAVAAGYAVGR
jgi:hypothetical protein